MDPGKYYVSFGQSSAESGIALVGYQADSAGISHEEIGPGQSDVGVEIFFSEAQAGMIDQGFNLRCETGAAFPW